MTVPLVEVWEVIFKSQPQFNIYNLRFPSSNPLHLDNLVNPVSKIMDLGIKNVELRIWGLGSGELIGKLITPNKTIAF